jgi:hypothetical protein
MVPFYVMAMALAIGGRVETAQLVGGLLVVSGAVLAQWPAGRRPRCRGQPLSSRADGNQSQL